MRLLPPPKGSEFLPLKIMKEKLIEQKLLNTVRRQGGQCLKFTTPSLDGMPDRLLLLPEGKIAFVEVKAPGKKPRPLQIARHRMLQGLGFLVYVIDSEEQIQEVLNAIQAT